MNPLFLLKGHLSIWGQRFHLTLTDAGSTFQRHRAAECIQSQILDNGSMTEIPNNILSLHCSEMLECIF